MGKIGFCPAFVGHGGVKKSFSRKFALNGF